MPRKYSAARRPVNDFQVFKGLSTETMSPFGAPVMVAHEAVLIARDDQAKQTAGPGHLYAIYKRSQNRIVCIIEQRLVSAELKLAA
jgi:hypothetical protein